MALDPSVLIEGVGGSAAAVGVARMRRRSPRVRREPIDVQLAAAEDAESAGSRDANQILAALEAEVGRTETLRHAAGPVRVATETPTVPLTPTVASAPPTNAVTPGIPPDQVSAWMVQIQEDLRKVRSRVQYLQLEQARLEDQQRLMAQLITSSTPI